MLPWPSSRSMAYRPNGLGITTGRESRSSIASKLSTLRLPAVHSPVSQSPCGQLRRKLEGRASFIDSASEHGQVESRLYRAIDLAISLQRGTPEGRQMRLSTVGSSIVSRPPVKQCDPDHNRADGDGEQSEVRPGCKICPLVFPFVPLTHRSKNQQWRRDPKSAEQHDRCTYRRSNDSRSGRSVPSFVRFAHAIIVPSQGRPPGSGA